MTEDEFNAKAERVTARVLREMEERARNRDINFFTVASTATSGLGDEYTLGGSLSVAELGRQLTGAARKGAEARNAAAKELHPKYQELAEEYWLRHPRAGKKEAALWVERQMPGTKMNTIRGVIQKPMARKLMSAG